MSNTASLKKEYAERIAPALKNQFQDSSTQEDCNQSGLGYGCS